MLEEVEFKTSGNAPKHGRKRTRSHSPKGSSKRKVPWRSKQPQSGPAAFYNPAAPAFGLQQPVMENMNQLFLPQNPVPFPQQDPKVSPPKNYLSQADVNDLLAKLISTGIIKPFQPEATPTSSTESSSVPPPGEKEEEKEEEKEQEMEVETEDTSFSTDKPYAGKQCRQCSMHFAANQTKMYADHLDWHFRENHARKEECKKQRWYYSYTDWTELNIDLGEHTNGQVFDKEIEIMKEQKQAATKAKQYQLTRATKSHVNERCETCQEPFETLWVDEEEDWFLKNAIKVADKSFHPTCFEDYKKNTHS